MSDGKKEGYLTKTNRKGKKQQRYFVLDGGVLSFYKVPLGKRLGVIDANNAKITGLGLKQFLIESESGKEVLKYIVGGKDAQETQSWKQALRHTTGAKTQSSAGGAAVDKFGWMVKKGKDRWFLLHDTILYWFTQEVEPNSDFRKKARGSAPMEGCTVGTAVGVVNGIQIIAPDSSYVLQCKTADDKYEWLAAFQRALEEINSKIQSDLQHSGYLEKKKQQRYFVLKGSTLKWYLNERDGREKGAMEMGETLLAADTDQLAICIVSTKDQNVRYRLFAKDAVTASEWRSALRAAIERGKSINRKRIQTIAPKAQNQTDLAHSQVLVEKSGWFLKKRKRRFFVLRNNVLMWFLNEVDSASSAQMKGSLNLSECAITSRGFDINIRTKDKTLYTLTAQRKPEVQEWLACMEEGSQIASEMKPAVSTADASLMNGKSGWVMKKGLRRFLILRPGDLIYFDKEQQPAATNFVDKPKGIIRLACCTVNEVSAQSFLVRSEETANKGWVFDTATAAETSEWVALITVFIIRAQEQLDSGLSQSGWLTKKGQKRWFALKAGTLLWFNQVQPPDSISDSTANGSFRVEGCKIKQCRDKQATFTIEGEKIERDYELTAFNDKECNNWMMALRACASPGGFADPFAAVNPNGKVFGKPLTSVLAFDGAEVPVIVTNCVAYLERHGLLSPGLFRLSGSSSAVQRYRQAYDEGAYIDFNREAEVQVNDVAGMFKLWIRQLPEPPLTFALYTEFLQNRADVEALRNTVHRLPAPNYKFLAVLASFLSKVIEHAEENHMNVSNIAIVIGPNLLRAKNADMISGLKDTPLILEATKTILTNIDYIFQ